ncbi:MAG: hypothetical protein AAFY59_06880 [Pseudomonadota bacterium]
MNERHKMEFGDWLNGTAILAVSLFIGLAVGEWVTLEGAAFWLTIIYIFIPFGFVFVFIFFMSEVSDLSSGIKRPVSRPPKRPKPLALLASLPAGFFIGVIGAQFGLSEILLSGI